MKFYLWRPTGHGPHSFGVMASSEEEARLLIDEHIQKKHYVIGKYVLPKYEYQAQGWPENYELSVIEAGEIFEHEND